jgi:hypothetical protein
MQNIARGLIAAGAVLLVCGVLLILFPGLRIGRLPGDLSFRKGGVHIYLPLMTSLLISLVLSLLLWLFRR